MQIIDKQRVTVIALLLSTSLLTGCPATLPQVVTREIVTPCVKASELPTKPEYEFDSLPVPTSNQEDADAVKALKIGFEQAKVYSEVLEYLIQPCIGVRNENQPTK